MATLNTLRTRGGIVVSIVIGIALLAFLLGDFGNQGASAFQERENAASEKSTGKRSDIPSSPTRSTT